MAEFHIVPDNPDAVYTTGSNVTGKVVLASRDYKNIEQAVICLRGIAEVKPYGQECHVHEFFSVMKDLFLESDGKDPSCYECPFELVFPETTLPGDRDDLWPNCAEFEHKRRHSPPPSLRSSHGAGKSAFKCTVKYELVAVFQSLETPGAAPINHTILLNFVPPQRSEGWDDEPAPVRYLLSHSNNRPSDPENQEARSSLRERFFSTVIKHKEPQSDPGFELEILTPYRIKSLDELSLKFYLNLRDRPVSLVKLKALFVTLKQTTFARFTRGVGEDTSKHSLRFDLDTHLENESFIDTEVFRVGKQTLNHVPSFRSFIIARVYSLSVEAWVERGPEGFWFYREHIPLQIVSPYPAKPQRMLVQSEIPLGMNYDPDSDGRAGCLDPGRQAYGLPGVPPPYEGN